MSNQLKFSSVLIMLCMVLFSLEVFSQSTQKHTVKPGETFYHIATEYGIKVGDLQKANPSVGTNYAIKPGQVLTIPAGGAKAPVAKTTEEEKPITKIEPVTSKTAAPVKATSTTTATEDDGPQPTRGYHTVKAGETTITIARDFGITVDQLKKWNDGLKLGAQVGTKLKVVDLDNLK